MTQNLWDAAKAVLRGKYIAIQSYLKKQEKHQIDSLTLHLKQLEEQNPKISRRKEIIKIRAEINEKEIKEIIMKTNKTKSWFFEKINKIDKPLARLIKKKKREREKRIKSTKLEMKKEKLTDNAEIQRIIRDYYEQLYGNKMDNLKEMDRFLEKLNLPRLNQEEIEIMNNTITSSVIEAVIKNLPQTKT